MVQTIRYVDLVETPWKNGGGTMREIARGGPDPWSPWQIGRACVIRDGAFSRFDGLVRILTVVEGAGLMLVVGAARLEALPLVPVRFDGDTATEAFLQDGPVSPFNLIFDPRHCDGRVEVLRGPLDCQTTGAAATTLAVHAIAGGVRVGQVMLDPNDTAILGSSPVSVFLGDEAVALLVTLEDTERSSEADRTS